MGYPDEEIVKLMTRSKLKEEDIHTGVYIKGEKVEFEETILFNGKMSVMLPASFVDMAAEIAKLKYLMEQRPQLIKTNVDGSVNFTFSFFEQLELNNKQISSVINIFHNSIKSTQPSTIFYEKKIEIVKSMGTTIGWFDFKSHGVDQKIYNLMYCVPIAQRVMHGIFNCPFQTLELWKPYALQVIRSIKDLTLEPKNEEKQYEGK